MSRSVDTSVDWLYQSTHQSTDALISSFYRFRVCFVLIRVWVGFKGSYIISFTRNHPLSSSDQRNPSPLSSLSNPRVVLGDFGAKLEDFRRDLQFAAKGITPPQIQELFITSEASNISPNLVPFFLNVFKWFYWDLFGLKRILSTKIGFLLHVTWRCAFSV